LLSCLVAGIPLSSNRFIRGDKTMITDEKAEEKSTEKKQKYVTPETRKHDPLNIVRGTGHDSSGLYSECSLYYYY
jgi:hypothetical protein